MSRIRLVIFGVIGFGILGAVISNLVERSRVYVQPDVPPKSSLPDKPTEIITFTATVANVRKITRGSSVERYEIILSGAPPGQGDLTVWPNPYAPRPVNDGDMSYFIGKPLTVTCEKYVHKPSCFWLKSFQAGDLRFDTTLKWISWSPG